MKRELDIYGYDRLVKCAVDRVLGANISDVNKKIIFDFKNFCLLDGIGVARIVRYLGSLKDMALNLGVDFDKATKEDIMRIVTKIQERVDYSPYTKSTYKKILKRFYWWLKNCEPKEYPVEVKWIRAGVKKNERILPSNGDLLTEDDVKLLIDNTENLRDKAFVSVLYESGARVGEIGSLQLGNVRFDEYGAVLFVEGKTGQRPIRIMSSTPYLMNWLQNHPFKGDNGAPLWVSIRGRKRFPLKYSNIRLILKRLFARCGIKKRGNPHLFRHSRATFLANHLTEFQMNHYFGWIQGSGMPSTYVHMSGQNIDNSILELNGVKCEKSANESSLKPKVCSRCDTINPHDSKFCKKCAGILDLKTAFELENKFEKEKEVRTLPDQLMNTLMKDPEFLQMMMNKMKEIGLRAN